MIFTFLFKQLMNCLLIIQKTSKIINNKQILEKMKSVSTAITELSEAIAGIQQLIEISQKYHEHHSLDKFVNI